MINRKLASIQKILSITTIPNSDNLEVCQILGWNVVIRKGDFTVGEKIVYCEVDSILPEKPEFEFLRPRGFRIKTIKLRGQISQGIALPLNILTKNGYVEGMDVTEELGIKKYVPYIPAQLVGKVKGSFPSFIPKTDEIRIQSVPEVLTRHNGKVFNITEKVDGCLAYNMPIFTDQGYVLIGRIVNQKRPIKIWSYNHKLKIAELKPIETYHKYPIKQKKLLKIACKRRGVKGNRTSWIKCTDNHEFYTDSGYKPAKNLKVGETVYRFSDKLSEIQKQLMLGLLLGDGGLSVRNDSFIFSICQGIAQKEYFQYKAAILNKLFSQHPNLVGKGFPGSKPRLRGIIRQSLAVKNFLYLLGITTKLKRQITHELCHIINPIGFAFWYMDDGSLQGNSEKQRPRAFFATNSFSVSELTILQKTLKSKFNLNSTIHTKKIYKGNVLSLDSDSSEIFFELIAPYVCTSMKYKLPIKYNNYPCVLEKNALPKDSQELTIIPTKITKIEEDLQRNSYSNFVYDLTIKDNHNYFTCSVLVHNSSMTAYYKDGNFGVCSRNLDLLEDETNSFWKVARKLDLEHKLSALGFNVAIQGELLGPGVQKNKYKMTDIDLYVFNIFNIDQHRYLNYDEYTKIAEFLELKTVPIIGEAQLNNTTVDDLVAVSRGDSEFSSCGDGKSVLNKEIMREGLVFRPLVEEQDPDLGRLSFKAINPKFLLKYDE